MTCKACIPRSDTAVEIERTEALKKRKGCVEQSAYPQYSDDETGELFFRCPLSQITHESWALQELCSYVEGGFLPSQGGILDQSAYLLARFRVIKAAVMEITDKKQKQAEAKTKNKIRR